VTGVAAVPGWQLGTTRATEPGVGVGTLRV